MICQDSNSSSHQTQLETKMRQTQITINVELDENHVPEKK